MRHYGWKPDLPDHRDFEFAAPRRGAALPKRVDLRSVCPAVYDQGELGSCTANAIAAAHEFEQMKQSQHDPFIPSRLFIYYGERALEGTVSQDSGAEIRDGMKVVAKQGVCPEVMWQYLPTQFAKRPGPKCYASALNHQVLTYSRVPQTLVAMRGCLAAGFPFVFGFTVYESFESASVAKSGKVQMPSKHESALGGHAVLAVGYDDAAKRFIVRNSWGAGWGMSGYMTMPYPYLESTELASDLWTIRLVE
jgi:C1A family cysteine protease